MYGNVPKPMKTPDLDFQEFCNPYVNCDWLTIITKTKRTLASLSRMVHLAFAMVSLQIAQYNC